MPLAGPRAAPKGARAPAPSRRVRLTWIGAFGAIAVAIAAALFALPREPRLVIRDSRGGLLAEFRLPDGRFSQVFLHSFHLTPVEERFEVEPVGRFGARIRLKELRYQSPGVGMPSDAEGGYRLENGFFVLSMDRVFDSIPILISILPGHGIVAEGAYLPFRNWAGPEDGIRLSARMAIVLRLRR